MVRLGTKLFGPPEWQLLPPNWMHSSPNKPDHQNVESAARMKELPPKWRFITSVARRGRPTKKPLNVVINESLPLNMRRPVYNAGKMGKLHWQIHAPDFF